MTVKPWCHSDRRDTGPVDPIGTSLAPPGSERQHRNFEQSFGQGPTPRSATRVPSASVATRPRGRPAADDPTTVSTEAILDAALRAFAERGYDGTSVREVARSLGVSHNLIPQRIGSKDDLWYAAVERGFAALSVALVTAIAELDEADDLDRLRALVVRFIEANSANPALLRIITQEAAAPGPRLDHLFTTYIGPVHEFGSDLLRRLKASGEVRTDSAALVYFLMTHGAGGPAALPALAERFGEEPADADPEAAHRRAVEATAILFDGLVT